VQFTGDFTAFDIRTGEFWSYAHQRTGSMSLVAAGKITKLGQPEIALSVEKR
jgi:hypothetical protein